MRKEALKPNKKEDDVKALAKTFATIALEKEGKLKGLDAEEAEKQIKEISTPLEAQLSEMQKNIKAAIEVIKNHSQGAELKAFCDKMSSFSSQKELLAFVEEYKDKSKEEKLFDQLMDLAHDLYIQWMPEDSEDTESETQLNASNRQGLEDAMHVFIMLTCLFPFHVKPYLYIATIYGKLNGLDGEVRCYDALLQVFQEPLLYFFAAKAFGNFGDDAKMISLLKDASDMLNKKDDLNQDELELRQNIEEILKTLS